MAPERNNREIKNLLINFRVQNRIVLVNLFFMMLVMILTMTIIYTHLTEVKNGTESVWKIPLGELTMVFSLKLIMLYTLLFITFILSVLAQLSMTHKVCGPLVNFCNTYKKIARGEFLTRIHLRRNDLLQKEADQFNEMVRTIGELVNELKTENEKLNSAVKNAVGKNRV